MLHTICIDYFFSYSRRLFPTIDVDVFGLDPKGYYSFKVDIVAADTKRYKYVSNTGWVGISTEPKACRSTNQVVFGECEHPNSPNTGKFWMNSGSISFKKLKLSNSKEHYKKSDCVSMHGICNSEVTLSP